jgi:hypothetical protein
MTMIPRLLGKQVERPSLTARKLLILWDEP